MENNKIPTATLIKRGTDSYEIYVNEVPFATTDNSPYKRLSKQNCDELFGVIDVEKLGDDHALEMYTTDEEDIVYYENRKRNFIEGFNKAIELNKDKLFTLEDMENSIEMCIKLMNDKGSEFREHKQTIIQSLQQPTEIEVEILYMRDCQAKTPCNEYENKCLICTPTYPKLDSEGCLILKKI